jgi:glycosyltransferase involved in cell wall biosynthesis
VFVDPQHGPERSQDGTVRFQAIRNGSIHGEDWTTGSLACVASDLHQEHLVTRVSVVTVCFNAAKTIKHALRSVSEQSYANLEHVIIDGGSTDGTVDLVRHHGARVSTLVSERDGGIYDAMNRGLRCARGELVLFLNADDQYADRDCVADLAHALAESGAESAYGDIAYVRDDAGLTRVRQWKSGTYLRGAFTKGWAPPHPTFLARRDRLLELGGFDLRYRLAADFDLMMRALDGAGMTAAYVPRELVLMRVGGATNANASNVLRQNMEIIDSLRRAGHPFAGPAMIARKIVSRIRQRAAARGMVRREPS